MGKVQATVEEMSQTQVLCNGHHSNIHYGIKAKHSHVIGCICRRDHKNQDICRGKGADLQHVSERRSIVLEVAYRVDQNFKL